MAKTHRWDGIDPWDRLMAKCVRGDTWEDGTHCYLWNRAVNSTGYGSFWLNGGRMSAHRAAWIIAHREEIPAGMEIDHLCRNRRCVNPLHLEVVTHRENLLRGDTKPAQRAQQTHCKRGHEFTPENTRRSKRGERVCRTCAAAREWGRRHGYNTDLVLLLDPGRSPHTNVDDVARHMALIEAGEV